VRFLVQVTSQELNEPISQFPTYGSVAPATHRPTAASTVSPQIFPCMGILENRSAFVSGTRRNVQLSALHDFQNQICICWQRHN
jgi:hypothetical protein